MLLWGQGVRSGGQRRGVGINNSMASYLAKGKKAGGRREMLKGREEKGIRSLMTNSVSLSLLL